MLKLILVVTMTLDHVAVIFLPRTSELYRWFRMFGRPALPIACFLLAEGFVKTASRKKYLVRMAVTAVVAELFWIFLWVRQRIEAIELVQKVYEDAGGDAVWKIGEQDGLSRWYETVDAVTKNEYTGWIVPMFNVLFTLTLCILMLMGLCKIRQLFNGMEPGKMFHNFGYLLSMGAVIYATLFVCLLIGTDYPVLAPIMVAAAYIFRGEKVTILIIYGLGSLLSGTQEILYAAAMLFGVFALYFYNGELGYDKKTKPWVRIAFYAYYPLHLAILVEARYFDVIFDSFRGISG